MNRFEQGLHDSQNELPVAYCSLPWCKGEIYKGEIVVKYKDFTIHEDCFELMKLYAEKVPIEGW
jgi:hypothetical protein